MINEETTKTNSESADESAGGQTTPKDRFEIPECCRQMMAQMTGGRFCNSGEGESAEYGSGSQGTFGDLVFRMMKACCGQSAEKHSRSAQGSQK